MAILIVGMIIFDAGYRLTTTISEASFALDVSITLAAFALIALPGWLIIKLFMIT